MLAKHTLYQMSYTPFTNNETRTHIVCLEGRKSTINLYSQKKQIKKTYLLRKFTFANLVVAMFIKKVSELDKESTSLTTAMF